MGVTPLSDSRIAAWKVKARLLRYRAFRQAASLGCRFRSVRDRVYLWPAFNDSEESQLSAIQSTLSHFLHGLDTYVVFFQRDQAGFKRHIYETKTDSIRNSTVISEIAGLNELRKARYCVKWRNQERPRARSLHPWIYSVAEGPDCHGINDWLRLVSDLYCEHRVLPDRVIPFPAKSPRTCAVLGTGPSLDYFLSEGSQWDVWIGANTIACDERIWSKGTPFALCIEDPYFFGPTGHWKPMWAGAFRLLRETPAVLVTTRLYAPYIEITFPEDIRRKCCYVRMPGHDSYRLLTQFELPTFTTTPYGNVLTDLMLPLASSISRRVIIYGCDGRPPNASLNFPKSVRHQRYDDEWHANGPMYFDESVYSTYINKHSLYTRYVVEECLNHGVEVTMRCPSWNSGFDGLPIYPAA